MVHHAEGSVDESVEKQMRYKMYVKTRRAQDAKDSKKSAWYRYFFPNHSDWNVK